jgi:hypothetical protein
MDLPFYKYYKVREEDVVRYYFYSEPLQKRVLKVVKFTPIGVLNFYNVALADVLDDGSMTDQKTSKDFDRDLIITTVTRIMLDFLDIHPYAKLSFQGNTPAKTRLYRMALSIFFEKLSAILNAYGVWQKEEGFDFEPFKPNIN